MAFTPDEEIGRGTEHFPLTDFSADFAYTVDGGAVGELNYETFNACNATVTFYGVSVHPGSAKNKMRNAVTMAAKWQELSAGKADIWIAVTESDELNILSCMKGFITVCVSMAVRIKLSWK